MTLLLIVLAVAVLVLFLFFSLPRRRRFGRRRGPARLARGPLSGRWGRRL